jgi:hypothetical protein
MVPVNEMKPPAPVKLYQKVKYIQVLVDDIGKFFIFPKFISVPDFYIRITFVIVMVQGGKIQIFIPEEFVCLAPVPPVAVAHQNDPGRIIYGDPGCRFEQLGQTI